MGLPPLIRPIDLQSGRNWELADGTRAPADTVYAMFVAARDGDVAAVRSLVAEAPGLATVEYNYTPPIHFAAREGHAATVRFLLAQGADPDNPQDRLARLIEANDLVALERAIAADPGLARLDDAFWGDGVLAGPAHEGNHDVIALLIRLGARVPLVSKWAPY